MVENGAAEVPASTLVAEIVADAVDTSSIDAVIDGILGSDAGPALAVELSDGGAAVFALLDVGVGGGHDTITVGALDPLVPDMSAVPDTTPVAG